MGSRTWVVSGDKQKLLLLFTSIMTAGETGIDRIQDFELIIVNQNSQRLSMVLDIWKSMDQTAFRRKPLRIV